MDNCSSIQSNVIVSWNSDCSFRFLCVSALINTNIRARMMLMKLQQKRTFCVEHHKCNKIGNLVILLISPIYSHSYMCMKLLSWKKCSQIFEDLRFCAKNTKWPFLRFGFWYNKHKKLLYFHCFAAQIKNSVFWKGSTEQSILHKKHQDLE